MGSLGSDGLGYRADVLLRWVQRHDYLESSDGCRLHRRGVVEDKEGIESTIDGETKRKTAHLPFG